MLVLRVISNFKMAGRWFLVKAGREMFVCEMIEDLPYQAKKKELLTKMARMTRWLADLADPRKCQ